MKKNKNIHWHRIKQHTQDWYDFRYNNGIGGSEIASVMAIVSQSLSDLVYTPPIKWYLSKIGEPVQEFTGNVESESGHYFEPIILNFYKYYDLDSPSQMDMFRRIREGRRLNRVLSPRVFVTNDKYPGFFYSPDAFVWPGNGKTKRLAECKNTTSMTARRFTNKVDPAFYLQVQQGLMITELEEADLLILVDGRWFEVITIQSNKDIQNKILSVGSDMWKRVLKARQLKIEYGISSYYGSSFQFDDRQNEGVQLLSSLEPELIGTDDELDFIKEMVVTSDEVIEMQGTDEQKKLCVQWHSLGEQLAGIKKERDKVYEKLILSLSGSNVAIFGDKSFFSFKKDNRGIKRLYVSDKMIKSESL